MTDPEYLRNRAKQADLAGATEMAESLNAEADELESVSAPAEGVPQ